MQNLSEKVYECTLPVEAHMICDLLAGAGIPARVEGEFLSGAGGDLPLGNLVKVRVEPSRAAEAREVIEEWEKTQVPDPVAVPVTKTARFRSPLWFLVGVLVGGAGVFVLLNSHMTNHGRDWNGDGIADVSFSYVNGRPSMTEIDRNFDGKTDDRWTYDLQGVPRHYEHDDDFDGRFEWQCETRDGECARAELDVDGDGRPEQVWHYEHGVLASIDYYYASGGRIVKRQFFNAGLLVSADYDDDGDGVFERHVQYDSHGEPKL